MYKAMAFSKPFLAACLLISLLLLHVVVVVDADQQELQAQASTAKAQASLQQIDCNGACAARCRLASRQTLCHRSCGTCCARCNCVPPGTAGNEEVCPCYYNMKTHGGRPKCP